MYPHNKEKHRTEKEVERWNGVEKAKHEEKITII